MFPDMNRKAARLGAVPLPDWIGPEKGEVLLTRVGTPRYFSNPR